MDDKLLDRYRRAQERIELERLKRGIAPRLARITPSPLPVQIAEPFDFGSVLDRIPKLSPEQEAEETSRRVRQEQEREAEWARKAREEKRKRIGAHNLPITTADELLLVDGDLQETPSLAFVRQWEQTEKPWLTLCGTVGRGKTMAAAWALAKRGGTYVQARELERIFAARYGDELEAQERVLTGRTLVIDDIGRERDAEGMTTALLEVIDQRRRDCRRTIAITNLSKSAFLERYADPRLHSRLCESGAWGVDSGADMRRQ